VKEVIALKSEKKSDSRAWRIVARAAVCAAVVVAIVLTAVLWPKEEGPGNQLDTPSTGTTAAPTMPTTPIAPTQTQGYELVKLTNVVKVYTCDVRTVDIEELEEYEISESEFRWRAVWSVTKDEANKETPTFGRPITFQIPEAYFGAAEITFHISSEQEGFCNELMLENGEVFYLAKQIDTETKRKLREEKADKDIYLDVIIYADENVVGYGVISFYMCSRNGYCYAYKSKMVLFPMLDGEMQNVSEEYVRQRIEEYKQTQPEGQGAEFFRKLRENDE